LQRQIEHGRRATWDGAAAAFELPAMSITRIFAGLQVDADRNGLRTPELEIVDEVVLFDGPPVGGILQSSLSTEPSA
jgi:hypothetical protein